ncbi:MULTISPECIES: NADPH dehydrogenase NamA [unclassified Virgibacillus]|uniref:NADPH dehydrogenase NamA n=1 Tax=unclassified Virgibacillus TaxID=2620237 RepID=UPI0024DE0203|nr:NADPH dehydrogenase NamA [Virgibacillus sp. LDC-1]
MPSLFSPIQFKDITLKNRIVMSPMCMYASQDETGKITPFHMTHYISRAVGQVGLIMVEATAVLPEGRISANDLGIWNDVHIDGLKTLNDELHSYGAKTAIQLGHAGRKAVLQSNAYAPSPLSFDETSKMPVAMEQGDINRTVLAFKEGAKRAKAAGFDIIEIHAAHGYLINQFLSPLTNIRTDRYGGSIQNRYRFLKEIIEAIKTVWNGPVFVRISANEYDEKGNTIEDILYIAKQMKSAGVDLIDCSSGGVVPAAISSYPGYQVTYSETIKNNLSISTGAVGLITSGVQAEEIIQNKRADLVFIGRALLRNPYWPKQVADELNISIPAPLSYKRGWK